MKPNNRNVHSYEVLNMFMHTNALYSMLFLAYCIPHLSTSVHSPVNMFQPIRKPIHKKNWLSFEFKGEKRKMHTDSDCGYYFELVRLLFFIILFSCNKVVIFPFTHFFQRMHWVIIALSHKMITNIRNRAIFWSDHLIIIE